MKRSIIRLLPLATLLLLVGVGCDSDPLVDPSGRMLGVVEWNTDPIPGAAPAEGTIQSQTGSSTLFQSRVTVPDTIRAGEPFTASITSVGPVLCWDPDGADVEADGNLIRVTLWDRRRNPDLPCSLIIGHIGRNVELTFAQPGLGRVQIDGRRVLGEDQFGGRRHTIERTFEVR